MFINAVCLTRTSLLVFLTLLSGLFSTSVLAANTEKKSALPTCAYIASYATGYDWQDRLSQTLYATLDGHCQVKTFYMDSKQVHQEAQLVDLGLMAKQFIDFSQPDVMIFSDDNAVKYVLQPHFKNTKTPVAFCGLNETVTTYGLPYQNATGMVEVAGFSQLIHKLLQLNANTQKIAYLSSYGITEEKAMASFEEMAKSFDIKTALYKTYSEAEWRKTFKELNADTSVDFILMGRTVTLPKWHGEKNLAFVKQETQKATVSLNPGLLPFSVLGATKSPEEQGRWAALVAIELLKGTPASEIPVIPNQSIQYWYHPTMITSFPKLRLSAEFMPATGLEVQ